MRQVINLFNKTRIIKKEFSKKKGELCMKVDIYILQFLINIMGNQISYLLTIATNTEIQILLTGPVLTAKDVLISFGQSILIGTVCHYVIEWIDRFIKKFIKKLKKFLSLRKQ